MTTPLRGRCHPEMEPPRPGFEVLRGMLYDRRDRGMPPIIPNLRAQLSRLRCAVNGDCKRPGSKVDRDLAERQLPGVIDALELLGVEIEDEGGL